MARYFFRHLLPLVCVALLGGCAGVGTRPVAPGPVDVTALSAWEARGRIAVSGAEGGGSGSFRWEQKKANSDILIRGPVGIGSLRVRMNSNRPDQLRLAVGDGRELQAEAALAELETRLGAAVPADKLRYWMLGIAAPGAHQWIERTDRSAILEQDGWRIEFLEYTDEAGAATPRRVKATSGEARIRVVINDWELGPRR